MLGSRKEISVFIFTGFLDSGKTNLLVDTLKSPDFAAEKTLLIVCEEGEEDYDEELMRKLGVYRINIEEPEALTDLFLLQCAKKVDPDQVMIEYNGTWPMENILGRNLPKYWAFCGVYSTVDATTADLYLTNMRSIFLEQLSQSGLIIVNRCKEDFDRMRLRRILKAWNPAAQMVFEREDGEIYDPDKEPLPYSLEGDVIEIEDLDYGVWYLDAMEHPEHYRGKSVRFLAQVYRGRNVEPGTFVPGRFIMTCCADDIRFMGYPCRYQGEFAYRQRDWVRITAEFDFAYSKAFREEVPFLTLKDILPAKPPKQDPVYF